MLINNKTFEINIKVIINRNLYKKNIIDENTFIKAQEQLLKKLKELKQ